MLNIVFHVQISLLHINIGHSCLKEQYTTYQKLFKAAVSFLRITWLPPTAPKHLLKSNSKSSTAGKHDFLMKSLMDMCSSEEQPVLFICLSPKVLFFPPIMLSSEFVDIFLSRYKIAAYIKLKELQVFVHTSSFLLYVCVWVCVSKRDLFGRFLTKCLLQQICMSYFNGGNAF